MDRREIGRILAKAREDGATTLDLTGKGLGTLPPEIGNLTNLRLLALSFNDLTVLPAEIGNLTNLVNLYLNHNQLWVLPPQIGKLSSLQYLNLRDNRLMGLPREIGNLTLLTNLDLRSNQLTELSPQLGTLIERGVVTYPEILWRSCSTNRHKKFKHKDKILLRSRRLTSCKHPFTPQIRTNSSMDGATKAMRTGSFTDPTGLRWTVRAMSTSRMGVTTGYRYLTPASRRNWPQRTFISLTTASGTDLISKAGRQPRYCADRWSWRTVN